MPIADINHHLFSAVVIALIRLFQFGGPVEIARHALAWLATVSKATKDSEAGKMPSEELLSAMAKFNEEMVKAGVMLDGNGLQPSSKGARVRFSGDKRSVIDGPFAETKELVAGYWILQCKSLAETIEWIKRFPPSPRRLPLARIDPQRHAHTVRISDWHVGDHAGVSRPRGNSNPPIFSTTAS